MLMPKGKLNTYTCTTCGCRIVTVDRDEGTTPYTTRCRAAERCSGTMKSSLYNVPSWAVATHEWYRPSPAERARLIAENPAWEDYIDHGGLLLRKIPQPKPIPMPKFVQVVGRMLRRKR
jgi:hypothetical protein